MKKENVYKFLYIVAIFLIIGFIIRLGVDYFKYYEIYTLPFYYYIIERFLEFILIFSLSIKQLGGALATLSFLILPSSKYFVDYIT